jgi:hypothetical protein
MSRNRFHRRIVRGAPGGKPEAWAQTIADSMPFIEADATAIVNRVRVALQLLFDGSADNIHVITLGCAINVAIPRAEAIDAALADILNKAGDAVMECQRIQEAHGRYGLTGPGRLALAAGIDAYEAILRASSPRQMRDAEAEVRRRTLKQMEAST